PRFIVSLHCSSALLFFSFALSSSPSSTLFPYTTLFRSDLAVLLHSGLDPHLHWMPPAVRVEDLLAIEGDLHRSPRAHRQERGREDRKSTRLNSSHQIISYAVFCLKKKKNRKTPN